MAAPSRFTVSLTRSKRFEFLIYPTLTEMREAVRRVPGEPFNTRNCMAVCVCHGATANSPYVSTIYFCEKHVTPEYVAHECVHAAMALVKGVGDSPETDNGNETLAKATGLLVGRFWKRWRRSAK